MTKRGKLTTLLLTLLLGCPQSNSGTQPPRVIYGEDMCDECKMIINVDRFSCAFTTEKNTYRFDDIGCMFLFMSKHPDVHPLRVWVHDYLSANWIDAKNATYVSSKSFKTPMNYGILAFQKTTDAQGYAQLEDARVLSFDDLKNNPPMEMVMPGGMKK